MQNERLTVDDLLVLGNAVPDLISDERITVCTAGYSPKLGLVRIYPVPPASQMMRWNVVEVPLERNPRDNRVESWKIQGSKSDWGQIAKRIKLRHIVKERSQKLNDQRVSLGFIKPKIISFQLETREDFEKAAQLTLESRDPFVTIKNYPLRPVIAYRCSNCKSKGPHEQQVLEWGIYEWLRQHPDEPSKVWENLRMKESGYYRSFLVGNMALYRTSFAIISMFRHKL